MAKGRAQENRGGARPGAGRPKKTLGALGVERMLEATARYAKRYGKEVEELLLDICYGEGFAEEATIAVRLKAIERVLAQSAPRMKEGGPADSQGVPPAELPVRDKGPEGTVH